MTDIAWLFVKANWRWFAGAGAVVAIVLAVWLHLHTDAKTRAALVQAKADNAVWAQAYHDEKRAVDLQNASIKRLGTDAAAWERRAQDATAKAHSASVAAQKAASAFLAVKPKGATVCDRVEDIASRIREDVK